MPNYLIILFAILSKFDYSLKKQAVNDKKIYIIDNGFLDALSKTFTKDKGKLLENLVFTNLTKKYEVTYYADTQNECDFVISKNKQVLDTIQVCYELNDKNQKREIKGLEAAMKTLNLKQGAILTNTQEEQIKTNIKVMPVWKWLLKTNTSVN